MAKRIKKIEGSSYTKKGPPMAYSHLYWNWREAVRQGRGVAEAARAHSARFLPNSYRR